MSNPNRRLSNFLLTPKFQLKLTYQYIAVGLVIIVATFSAVVYKMNVIEGIMNNSAVTDFTAQTRITDLTFHIAQISLVGFVAFALASFLFALMVSHRVAGPSVGITAVIEELKKGNYDYGRRLRPKDELVPIMDSLHELKAVLKDKETENGQD